MTSSTVLRSRFAARNCLPENQALKACSAQKCHGQLVVGIPNAHEFREEVRDRGAAAALMCTKHQPIWKGLAELKYQLPGHEVRALATRSIEYLDSAATYCWLPSAMSLDLASLPRSDGIQYRAGVHQVHASLLHVLVLELGRVAGRGNDAVADQLLDRCRAVLALVPRMMSHWQRLSASERQPLQYQALQRGQVELSRVLAEGRPSCCRTMSKYHS